MRSHFPLAALLAVARGPAQAIRLAMCTQPPRVQDLGAVDAAACEGVR